MRTFLIGLAALAVVSVSLPSIARAAEVASPDGRVVAELRVEDGRLQYRIRLAGEELVAWSAVGLDSTAGDFRSGVRLAAESEPAVVGATYETPLGKHARVDHKAHEWLGTLQNAAGGKLDVRFRVANDGVAFAYRFPESAGAAVQVRAEATSFALPPDAAGFLHPMAVAKTGWSRTQPSYEELYSIDQPVGSASQFGQGWCLPALFRVADRGWVLIGETGVDANYFGARLAENSTGGVYRVELPQANENLESDPVPPTVAGGAWLPWRFVVVGESLAPIVASTMATDLVAPLYDIDWQPKSGRATWSWLALKDENNTEPVQRQFIDMADTLDFEYVLIDAGWDKQIGRDKIVELAAYARQKGVDLLLWYNSNGQWNDAPQTPRDRMHTPEVRAEEMAWLRETGIKGVKIDFFGGDKQAVMQLYDGMLRDGARFGLTVNFHGATLPRGWDRMYPNFITSEAVRGMEFTTFDQMSADNEAQHATVLPFTRNVIGPMDFTPVIVGRKLSPYNNAPTRRTTLGFELALPVLFHSPVQHFGLVPEDLTRLPAGAVSYLRELPTTWDETRLIDGYPGRFAVLARRKGDRWYVAAINGQDEPQQVTVPAELGRAWQVLRDKDATGDAVTVAPQQADAAAGSLTLELPRQGGAVLWTE